MSAVRSSTCTRGDLGGIAERQTIFVRQQHAIGLLHRCADSVPVERRERPQVDHFDADVRVLTLDQQRGLLRFLHQGAVGDYGKDDARLDDPRAAEGMVKSAPGCGDRL